MPTAGRAPAWAGRPSPPAAPARGGARRQRNTCFSRISRVLLCSRASRALRIRSGDALNLAPFPGPRVSRPARPRLHTGRRPAAPPVAAGAADRVAKPSPGAAPLMPPLGELFLREARWLAAARPRPLVLLLAFERPLPHPTPLAQGLLRPMARLF
ncbi:MAG: hypothetical protein J3K34DRAFT_408224 [Monoraphidium minutum]|nr:MAG: hypothetical protein J3K34DRAFT_408224 [Monoraphidium minutum]